jgi:LmbE family N-acetylglucosaminyl deacetylase
MAELMQIRPLTVLAIYAHPDDLEVSCGGALVQWTEAGGSAHLVTCNEGDKGSIDVDAEPQALAQRRAAEADAAARVLGAATHEPLGYPDGEIDNDTELRERLVRSIRLHRPDVVVCPDPTAVFFGDRYINHHDHRVVGWATLDACAPAAASPLYFPEAGPPHQVGTLLLSGTLEPDVWIDIGTSLDRKIDALLCHESQVGTDMRIISEIVRSRAAEAGDLAGVGYAESFRRVRLAS